MTVVLLVNGSTSPWSRPGDWTDAPGRLVARLDEQPNGLAQPVVIGATWTTDAPYRETPTAITQAEAAGVVAVEMEAAALYAYATARAAALSRVTMHPRAFEVERTRVVLQVRHSHVELDVVEIRARPALDHCSLVACRIAILVEPDLLFRAVLQAARLDHQRVALPMRQRVPEIERFKRARSACGRGATFEILQWVFVGSALVSAGFGTGSRALV